MQQRARIARLHAQVTQAKTAPARLTDVQQRARIARLQAQVTRAKTAPARLNDVQRRAQTARLQAQVTRLRAQLDAAPQQLTPEPPPEPPRPAVLLNAPPLQIDDLQRIRGVGPKLEELLNSLGVYQFAQIARFTAQDIAWLDERLNFKGRIQRDEWVAQARGLIAQP